MKIKLNGWQRLWIVFSLIYLAIIILFTWTTWPTKKQIENLWVYSTIDAIKEPNDYSYQIRESYKDISDRELIKKINAKYGEIPGFKEKLNEIDIKYQKKIQSLGNERLKNVRIAFMAWSIPLVILYLLGLAIGWIYKGFKKQ